MNINIEEMTLTILFVVCIITLFQDIVFVILFNKLQKMQEDIDVLSYRTERMYLGIKLLCKLKLHLDLEEFCDEYSNRLQNLEYNNFKEEQ